MWLADGWKEYEVIDTSNGEKLERWGDYILVRPDPQVIWDTPHDAPQWKKKNAHYHRSNKGGGEWQFFDLPKQWDVVADALHAGVTALRTIENDHITVGSRSILVLADVR